MSATIPTNRVGGGTSRSGQPPFFWIFPRIRANILTSSGLAGLGFAFAGCAVGA
jgi:hypothetical protein